MNRISKIISAAGISALSAVPLTALAQLGSSGPGAGLSLQNVATGIANAVWIVFTVIAIMCFLFAGIMFLTSMGEVEKIKTARAALIWGIVGIVVGLIAFGAVNFVKGILGG